MTDTVPERVSKICWSFGHKIANTVHDFHKTTFKYVQTLLCIYLTEKSWGNIFLLYEYLIYKSYAQ